MSLDKLRGAEGQVTVMQREMEAVQPKLAEASKEVDASMSNMEKEQVWKFLFVLISTLDSKTVVAENKIDGPKC